MQSCESWLLHDDGLFGTGTGWYHTNLLGKAVSMTASLFFGDSNQAAYPSGKAMAQKLAEAEAGRTDEHINIPVCARETANIQAYT